MTELTCQEFADLSAELALGILDGGARAAALGHVQHCDACQRELARQSSVADELVALTPSAEPPAGFETRVLAALVSPRRRLRRPRLVVALAAAVVAAAIGVGGWALGHGSSDEPETYVAAPAVSATFTQGSEDVGEVVLYGGAHPWVSMAIRSGLGDEAVTCRLVERDGRTETIGTFTLSRGRGYWTAPLPAFSSPVTSAQLVDAHGVTVASAALH